MKQADEVSQQMNFDNTKVDMFEIRFNTIEQNVKGFDDMQFKIKEEVIKHMGATPNLSEDVSKLMKASYGLDVPEIVKDDVVKHMEAIPNIATEVAELMKSAKSMDMPKLIDDKVLQSLQEASNAVVQQVIQRVVAIEMTVSNIATSSSSGQIQDQNTGHSSRREKVLLEYTAVNNLKALGAQGVKFKEWDEQLINVLSQFKAGAREVIAWVKERKEKKIERSEYDGKGFMLSYKYFGEELYSVLKDKTEG